MEELVALVQELEDLVALIQELEALVALVQELEDLAFVQELEDPVVVIHELVLPPHETSVEEASVEYCLQQFVLPENHRGLNP